jgi:predicted ABC-type ATPase
LFLYFLWIKNVEIAIERIAARVQRGGHSVPEDIVRRRFHRGLTNFFNLYRPLLDFWIIFDNSTEIPSVIAYEELGKENIIDPQLYKKLSE